MVSLLKISEHSARGRLLTSRKIVPGNTSSSGTSFECYSMGETYAGALA
jgi:hypothetical protein